MKNFSVIIPSYNSFLLDALCVKSFEVFKPQDLDIKYIVVENSTNTDYKEKIISISKNVVWVQNPTDKTEATANAYAIQVGMDYVTSDYVFIAHCDSVVCSTNFFVALDTLSADNELIGTCMYSSDGKKPVCHVSGLLVKSYIPRECDLKTKECDACEDITYYCQRNNKKYFCMNNTFNKNVDKFDGNFSKIMCDRAVYNGEIVYAHLGRGIPKTRGKYSKAGRCDLGTWERVCKEMGI